MGVFRCKMTKFEKKIEKKYDKDLEKARVLIQSNYFSKAEKRALSVYKYYKRTSNPKILEALRVLVDALTKGDRAGKALEYIEELKEYYKDSEDLYTKSVINLYESIANQHVGNTDKAFNCSQEALKNFRKINSTTNIIVSLVSLGHILYIKGNLEKALNYFKEAESLSLEHKKSQNLDAIYSPMASIYYRLNDNENFQKYFQKSVDNASQLGPPKLANYYVNIFKFFGSVGDLEKEYEFLLKGLEISEEYGYNIQKLMALMGLANFMIKQKYFDQAENFINEALKLSNDLDDNYNKAKILTFLGEVKLNKQEYGSAIKNFEDSLKLAKKTQDKFLIIDNYRDLGHIYKILENYPESYRNYSQCLIHYQDIFDLISTVELKDSFRRDFEKLPHLLSEINDIIESGKYKPLASDLSNSRKIATDICEKSKLIDPTLPREQLINEIKRLRQKENLYKGSRLETDARILFRREYNYIIEDSGKNFNTDEDEVDFLIQEGCQKDRKTKTVEIDMIGKKAENKRTTYVIGECKSRNRAINLKEIKCFLIKANIITQIYIDFHDKQGDKKPLFHVIIVSLLGFPSKDVIKELLEQNWDFPKERLISRSIELIDKDKFIKLLKLNNLPIDIYKD